MQSNTDVRSQVRGVLERFNRLVSTRDPQLLAEFAPGDEVLLVGSDAGEVATSREEIEAFFARIFARPVTFSWEWHRIEVSHASNVVWFFAEGWVILSTGVRQRRMPYRVSGSSSATANAGCGGNTTVPNP